MTPEYNGSCEAGMGAMEIAIHYRAALAGRSGFWTSEDTKAARSKANELQYRHGHTQPTPPPSLGIPAAHPPAD